MPNFSPQEAADAGRLRFLVLADCDHATAQGGALRRQASSGQVMLDFGDEPPLPAPPDPPNDREATRLLMEWEKEALGFYLSFHPCLTPKGEALSRLARHTLKDLAAASQGAATWVCGVVTAKPLVSKSGNQYARGTVDTPTGSADCTFFGEAWKAACTAAFDEPLALLLSATADPNAVTCERALTLEQASAELPAAALARLPASASLDAVVEAAKGLGLKGGKKGCLVFLEDPFGKQYRCYHPTFGKAELEPAHAFEFCKRLEAAVPGCRCEVWGRKKPLPPRKYEPGFANHES